MENRTRYYARDYKKRYATAASPASSLLHPVKHRWREGLFIFVIAISLLLLFALATFHLGGFSLTVRTNAAGKAGAILAYGLFSLFGYVAYALPFALSYVAWLIVPQSEDENASWQREHLLWRGLGALLAIVAGCSLTALQIPHPFNIPSSGGGLLGSTVADGLIVTFNFTGATMILFGLFLCGITLFTGLSWLRLSTLLGQWMLFAGTYLFEWYTDRREQKLLGQRRRENTKIRKITKKTIKEDEDAEEDDADDQADESEEDEAMAQLPPTPRGNTRRLATRLDPIVPAIVDPSAEEPTEAFNQQAGRRAKTIVLKTQFTTPLKAGLPPLGLLDPPEKVSARQYSPATLEAMSREVELRLKDFGIIVQVVAAHPGPVVTRYELQLAPGVKVSRITTLAKDLARSLSVISVRVVEVIPGKSVVGLELPNVHREVVRLSEVLSAPPYEQARSPLSLALGKDISGHPVVVDLTKMPHLLVAGTTGSGKSVGLNAMLLSLLFKASPQEVRMIMIDPKMLELSIYEGIPHLLAPVVTDMKEAANALRWCVAEMDRRYRVMAALGVRNLAGFNTKITEAEAQGEPLLDPLWRAPTPEAEAPLPLQCLPYIVVVVDEFADMIMVVGKKVEELIARIAQKARAAGIHLILATQRPSVDVITGLIKANIPTRIAFQVSSKIDSRTILDQQGAEQLLGHGDMLYLAPGTGVPIRVHGAFVADQEVHKVVEDWRQRGTPDYLEGLLHADEEQDSTALEGEENDAEQDPLYDQAVQIVIDTRRASISGIQRRLKIGYNRAARLIEAMEQAGLVGPMESNGAREVLIPERVD